MHRHHEDKITKNARIFQIPLFSNNYWPTTLAFSSILLWTRTVLSEIDDGEQKIPKDAGIFQIQIFKQRFAFDFTEKRYAQTVISHINFEEQDYEEHCRIRNLFLFYRVLATDCRALTNSS